MQTIPTTYRQAGHTMKLVRRDGDAVMFQSAGGDYWEVHKVRVAPPKEIFGKEYPEREILAGNEDFGTYAWACTSQERADARFKEVTAWQEMAESEAT